MAVNVGTAVAYLDLNMTAFNSGLQQAQTALQTFQSQTATSAQKMMATGGVIANVGQNLTRNVTVPLVSLGESSIQVARDFESAFAGVKKTIDESRFNEYSLTWDDLAEGIKQIAYETGISAEEIAGVMEIAGQLGVELGDQGKGIIEFTRQMALMGVTTDMAASDAALNLARFMNITNLTTDDVGNLTASIVDLGNNYATQEAEIVNMSMRLATAGSAIGMSAQDILALSTAMSSAGIKAEAGGSSLSSIISKLEARVRRYESVMNGTFDGTEKEMQGVMESMEAIAKVSGVSAEEFYKVWTTQPVEGLKLLTKGMAEAEERGDNMILQLDELGFSQIRQSNALRALAISFENMSGALDTSNKAWSEATAMEIEAEKRFETLDSRLNMLNERWKEVKREIAETLIPILEKLMDAISKLIAWWNDLDDSQKKMIVTIGIVVAAIPPLITVLGTLISTIGLIKGLKVVEGIASVTTAAEKANSVFKIGNVIFGDTYSNCNNTAMAVKNLAGSFNLSAETANIGGAAMKNYTGALQGTTAATEAGTTATTAATTAATGLATMIQNIFGILGVLGGGLMAVINFFKMWNDGIDAVHGSLMVLGIALAAIGAVLLGVPATVAAVVAAVVAIVAGLVLAIHEHWDEVKQWFSDSMESAKKKVGDFIQGVKNKIAEVKETISGIGKGIKEGFENAFRTIENIVKEIWEAITGLAKGFIDSILGGIVSIIKGLYDKVTDVIDKIKEKIENSVVGKAISAIKGFFDGSHANGLAYVPFDGYVAQLHKGERVLTADENKAYSSGYGGGNGTTINFYSNEKIDEYTAARELKRTMHDIKLGLV